MARRPPPPALACYTASPWRRADPVEEQEEARAAMAVAESSDGPSRRVRVKLYQDPEAGPGSYDFNPAGMSEGTEGPALWAGGDGGGEVGGDD